MAERFPCPDLGLILIRDAVLKEANMITLKQFERKYFMDELTASRVECYWVELLPNASGFLTIDVCKCGADIYGLPTSKRRIDLTHICGVAPWETYKEWRFSGKICDVSMFQAEVAKLPLFYVRNNAGVRLFMIRAADFF